MRTTGMGATLLGLAMLAAPVAVQAQRGVGPRQGGAVGNPVAPLINMRRDLNLTSRQLTQLDSIERSLLQRNRTLRESLRAGMDSVRPRGRQLTDEQRTALRARADSLRGIRQQIVRNDSTARAAAMRVLSDSQRTQVRIRQAEQRGFAMGRAAAARGERGVRQGFRGQGGPRGRMQPMAPRGRMGAGAMRPRVGPPGVGMGMGQRFQGRRPPLGDDQPGPAGGGFRRMGPPDGFGPGDGMGMGLRRRGMMGDSTTAPQPPVRRPPPDSGR